jgi:hypothetical protein
MGEVAIRRQSWDVIRKKFTISPSSRFYQVWKIFGICLALSSSFQYAYYASYLYRMTDEQKEYFDKIDSTYLAFFIIDFVIHILLDEH